MNARPRQYDGDRGFTLLELILVMVILSTVLAMAAPSLRGFFASRKTHDTAAQILALTQFARSQAISEGIVYRLNFDTRQRTYWLTAQQAGGEPEDTGKLRLDAAKIAKRYSETELPGHAAWIDGDWKLHRIADKSGGRVRFELYDLAKDPEEKHDLYGREPDRARSMAGALQAWQRSVIASLNGADYD